MRSKTLEGYLPQPLHAYVAAAYEALPQQLCRLPHKEIAALPNAFKDQVRAPRIQHGAWNFCGSDDVASYSLLHTTTRPIFKPGCLTCVRKRLCPRMATTPSGRSAPLQTSSSRPLVA